jgi:hypothetical protein
MIAQLLFVALFQAVTADPAPSATGAPAATPDATAPAAHSSREPEQAVGVENGRITHYTCRTVEIVGTRIGKRVCQTQDMTDNDNREAHDALQRLQNLPDGQSH